MSETAGTSDRPESWQENIASARQRHPLLCRIRLFAHSSPFAHCNCTLLKSIPLSEQLQRRMSR